MINIFATILYDATFIYLFSQVGSFGPCFLVEQPELVMLRDVTFNMNFIENTLDLSCIYLIMHLVL